MKSDLVCATLSSECPSGHALLDRSTLLAHDGHLYNHRMPRFLDVCTIILSLLSIAVARFANRDLRSLDIKSPSKLTHSAFPPTMHSQLVLLLVTALTSLGQCNYGTDTWLWPPSIEPCTPLGYGCSSCGDGYTACGTDICYNPGKGEICCGSSCE